MLTVVCLDQCDFTTVAQSDCFSIDTTMRRCSEIGRAIVPVANGVSMLPVTLSSCQDWRVKYADVGLSCYPLVAAICLLLHRCGFHK